MGEILPWHEIYRNTLTLHHISVAEKILRPLIVYVCLVVGLRFAGRRELTQMNPLDLVVLLTLSNTVQNAIIGEDNSVIGGLIGASTLLLVNYALVRLAYEHPTFDRLVNGDPVPLVEGGHVLRQNLRRLLMTEGELQAVSRGQGARHLHEVETAMFETSGTINVVRRDPTPEEAHLARLDERLARIEEALTGRK
ncbi:MAG: hypothetical protein QOF01_5191 [Thermomicrobiales bacterium]|jgi:uncharacterized membrane protein YcaP (DUF421 family)|nr:hypothetical protein [Thermomicrobiales bacterium]